MWANYLREHEENAEEKDKENEKVIE